MNVNLISLSAFLCASFAVAAVVSIVYDLFFRERSEIRDRLSAEFGDRSKGRSRKSPLFRDLKALAAETEQQEPSLWRRFQDAVEQSGVLIPADRLLLISAAAAVLAGSLGVIIGGSLWVGVGFLGVVLVLPVVLVHMKRKFRIEKLRRQLPEAFEMMSRAIRAGQTVSGALQVVSDHSEAPLAVEFAVCHEQQSLGLSQDIALRELARRSGVMELRMFAVTMMVQRQSGGNPVEVLSNLSSTIRKRIKMAGRIKALTGEGRMQALVLLVLPPVLFVALYVLNREYAEVLLNRPELLAGIAASEAVGALWIKRIVNFDF